MNKVGLFLFALFLLPALACGQLLVPVEEMDGGAGPAGGAGPSEVEAGEPLATLAPLPDGGDEQETAGAEEALDSPIAGDSIVVNDIAWTLLDAVYLGQMLESDTDEIADLVADGRLIGVRFTLSNEDDERHTYIGLEIADSGGERYSYMGGSLDFIIDEEACELVELEPGASVTCTVIYDVPDSAGGLQAIFTDLTLVGAQERLVGLGIE